MPNISQRTKLTLKEMGNPQIIATADAAVKFILLGQLVGYADGFVERKSPDGTQKFEGLSGAFRSIPTADGNADVLESGVLFIPEAFHNMIAASLRKAQVDDANAKIEFAFNVLVVRATNPQGYSWQFTPLIENPTAKNPIDDIVARNKLVVGPEALKALEAPKSAKK